MQCTSCGDPVKPVVAIDIDGTLGDYHGHLTEFMIGYTGVVPFQPYDGHESMKRWACTSFGMDERTWRDAKLAYRQGAQKRTMPLVDGAHRLCEAVRVAGAELWLTTTRPYLRLDNVDPDTREWLARNGITYDYLMYDEEKYRVLGERVEHSRVVAVVDDLAEMCQQAYDVFGNDIAIHVRSEYNELTPTPLEVGQATNLEAAELEIVARIIQWRKENHE